jgi:hypothetical protein
MTIVEIAAISLAFGILSAVIGWVWLVSTRISKAEAKAEAAAQRADVAGINVAHNTIKVDKVADELSAHRENTAKEYVSFTHMIALENRLVDAITGLGNRIDGLFSRVTHA